MPKATTCATLALERRADKANTWTFGGDELDIPDIIRAAVTDGRIALIDAPTAAAARHDATTIDLHGGAKVPWLARPAPLAAQYARWRTNCVSDEG